MEKICHCYFFATFLAITIFSCGVIEASTKTYKLGKNSARVTTGQHICRNGRPTEVTLSIEATLHTKSGSRSNFGHKYDRRMKALDKESCDHKGHILASAFGGPAVKWNLAPQADNLNKKYKCRTSILNVWYDCERWIRDNLKKKNTPIHVKITLEYEPNNCRPTHWSIEARNNKDVSCDASHISNGPLPFGCCQK